MVANILSTNNSQFDTEAEYITHLNSLSFTVVSRGILRGDGVFIPCCGNNKDYKEYLDWQTVQNAE